MTTDFGVVVFSDPHERATDYPHDQSYKACREEEFHTAAEDTGEGPEGLPEESIALEHPENSKKTDGWSWDDSFVPQESLNVEGEDREEVDGHERIHLGTRGGKDETSEDRMFRLFPRQSTRPP